MKTQSAIINPHTLPDNLTTAEEKFVKCVSEGNPCVFSRQRPELRENTKAIRAEVIRFFVYGGSEEKLIRGNMIRLQGALILGKLDLESAHIPYALSFIKCHFQKEVSLRHSECRFVSFQGSRLAAGLKGEAMKINGAFVMRDCLAEGEVRLISADIGVVFDCSGGAFQNKEGVALYADGARIGGNILMRNINTEGAVLLVGARVGGNLECDGATMKNEKGFALNVDGISTEGSVFLRHRFTAEGGVKILGAKIGRGLDCTGGKFDKGDVNANMINVGDNVFLAQSYFAKQVLLNSAKIGAHLQCIDSAMLGGLSAESARIGGALLWHRVSGSGEVVLSYAYADVFADFDKVQENFNYILDAFSYNRLAVCDAQPRIRCLESKPSNYPFTPLPFEQAARVVMAMGHRGDARDILFAMEKNITKFPDTSNPGWFWTRAWRRVGRPIWRRILEKATGYNYLLGRMLGTAAAIVVFGALVFGMANHHGYIVPHQPVVLNNPAYQAMVSEDDARRPTEVVERLYPDYPRFTAILFSVDVFIPLFALHQEPYWYPQAKQGDDNWWRKLFMFWYWVQIILGWILTSIFVLTATGILQQRQAIWGGK